MPLAEVIDWSVALVPVLVLVALFIWLDVFKLMTVWETLGLLLLGALAACSSIRCLWASPATAGSPRRGSRRC
jgi:hypothetical protein